MKYLRNWQHYLIIFFTGEHNQTKTTLSLMFVLLCAFIFLVKISGWQSKAAETMEDTAIMPVLTTQTITPTKWWIKMTATTSPSVGSASTASFEPKTSICSEMPPSSLETEIFAYVALKPPLPNRLRARASLSGEYIGQIESGAGLRVVDGPICTDGYSWWLVESLDKRLRGWTVEGRTSEQWLVRCPNVHIQCSFLTTPTPPSVMPPDDNPANPTEDTCRSDKLAVGMLAYVDQDSLLVIRAEPSVGAVIGHAGPMSIVNLIAGPACAGNAIWWRVDVLDLNLIGWTTEYYLEPCSKDSQCNSLGPS